MKGESVPEKIDHRSVRVALKENTWEEIPPDVEREHKTVLWADALYKNAMLIAASRRACEHGLAGESCEHPVVGRLCGT